jgi:hypothetical protein
MRLAILPQTGQAAGSDAALTGLIASKTPSQCLQKNS